ncbi:hypothetical protein BW731_09135 [Vagococcus martis]|uniref:Glycosyltransferase 2-like domain-containing protein n=1 Tax=Vagococcus martis TaxID=1768210 RepID=A0A1V4DIL5_9ENTE|nr:glycosyltransferase [Vagococcus martis]OPF88323.1 hypothetical protein BW731_09135 [Vagococcus martis]
MVKYDFVFVVLVYKNYDDFIDFYESVKKVNNNFQIVIVDSYYNEETLKKGKKIAKDYNIDFIHVPNKGYGFGNNEGIKYALNKYEFEHLVISNPDVKIVNLSIDKLSSSAITGPKILNLENKNQNPHYYTKNRLCFYLMKKYAESSKIFYLYLYLVINKFIRNYYQALTNSKNNIQVYSLHGSFIVIPKKVLLVLEPIFDESVFLYTEENFIADLAKKNNIKMLYDKELEIIHKEDGSSQNVNTRLHTLESLKIYFKVRDN